MTPEDFPKFAECLGTVAIACSKDLDDKTIDVYFKGLKDVPIELVKRAVPEIVRYHSQTWPRIPTWRKVIDELSEAQAHELKQIAADQAKKLLTGTVDESGDYVPLFHCGDCRDTGWRPDCGCSMANLITGIEDAKRAGECRLHGGRFVNGRYYGRSMRACECRPSNPVYLEKNPQPVRRYAKPDRDE